MSVVHGKDVILSVYKVDGYYPIACNTTCSLVVSVEELESTFLGNAGSKSFIPNKVSANLTGSGAIFLDRTLTIDDMYTLATTRSIIQWQFSLTDNVTTFTKSGYGFITSLSITGDVGSAASCDYTIRVTSNIDTGSGGGGGGGTTTVNYAQYISVGGESTISIIAITGKTVVDVELNGFGLLITGTNPPSGFQYVYVNAGTGELVFYSPLNAGDYVIVLYY
jgi:hypothetical protein